MLSNHKIAVYTVIIGPYDGLLPQPKFDNIDYLCFTDQNFKSKTWKIQPVKIKNNDPVRTARELKLKPHNILQEYEYSVFVDGNYLILKDLNTLVKQVMDQSPIGIFDHNQCSDARNCVYEEYKSIIELQNRRGKLKDDPVIMQKQIEHYKKQGYPANNGLIFSAVIIRQHHHPKVVATMEKWWDQIMEYSKRDQLSFNYASWITGLEPYYIPGDLRRHEYFFLLSKHRSDYRWKYFKYQLKKFFGLI